MSLFDKKEEEKKKEEKKKNIFRWRVRQVLYGGSAAFEQHHGPSLERKELREVNVAGGEHLFIALCNERPSTSTHLYTKHTINTNAYIVYTEKGQVLDEGGRYDYYYSNSNTASNIEFQILFHNR